MLSFKEIYSSTEPVISFEIFPPRESKTPEGHAKGIADTKKLLVSLKEFDPNFITVTYRASGKSREKTVELVRFLHQELNTTSVAHMTCTGQTKSELEEIFRNIYDFGVTNFLALRGDKIEGSENLGNGTSENATPSNARDFSQFLKNIHPDISIATAGYPEIHPDASSQEEEMSYLKEKVNSGAEVIITQLFFEVETYFDYEKKVRAAGIEVPIVPGIMPISSYSQLGKFVKMCGATVPPALLKELELIKDNPEEVKEFGTEYAARMCKELISRGAPGVHLYTLNKPDQVSKIVSSL